MLTAGWCIFTGLVTVGTIRTTFALFSLFFVLTIAFALLTTGYYKGVVGSAGDFIKAGGYFGLVAAFLAWYNAMAALWNFQNSWITLPVGRFPWAERRH